VRDELGLQPGDQLEFTRGQQGAYRIRKAQSPSRFARWRGVVKPIGGMSVDELIDEMRGR
jgi:hypothetical protein